MALRFYMDHHVPAAITRGLRDRGVDCLTAAEDGARKSSDESLLTRATGLGRVMFSMDVDMLVIASKWVNEGTTFSGLVYARQLSITIGQAVRDLELIATVLTETEMANRIEYIPL
jgi:predicted nuclease of predicted toxin-antitoxin system